MSHFVPHYCEPGQQLVDIKGTLSDFQELACGVPQGSVLGPILFNIYTSSLARLLQSQAPDYQIYADDISLYLSVKPSQLAAATAEIANCVSLVQRWMSQF